MLGGSPDHFQVLPFGNTIFTFQVANENIANELFLRGGFIKDPEAFLVLPSFRAAFSIATALGWAMEEEEDTVPQFEILTVEDRMPYEIRDPTFCHPGSEQDSIQSISPKYALVSTLNPWPFSHRLCQFSHDVLCLTSDAATNRGNNEEKSPGFKGKSCFGPREEVLGFQFRCRITSSGSCTFISRIFDPRNNI